MGKLITFDDDEELPKYDIAVSNTPVTIRSASRDVVIREIVRLMLVGQDGESYNLTRALAECNVPFHQWNYWTKNGYVAGPLEDIKAEIKSASLEIVLPSVRKMIEAQVNIAMGLPPDGTDMDVKPNHMTAAFKFITEKLGLFETTEDDSGAIADFIKEYKPPKMIVVELNKQTNNFIYQGSSGVKLPELPEDFVIDESPEDN